MTKDEARRMDLDEVILVIDAQMPRGAKPDRAETSDIAVLAGFAVCDAFAVSQRVPASVPAPILFVVVLCADGFDLRR